MRSTLRSLLIVTSLLLAGTALAQRSPFNGLEVLPADSTGHYRILIGGHFHGESTNRSGFPAASLLANLDTINKLGANLFLSTGDLFMDPVQDAGRYRRSLFRKLKVPLFNAPGNHDMADGVIATGLQSIRIGKLLLQANYFVQDTALHTDLAEFRRARIEENATTKVILLNTEANDGRLSSIELDEIKNSVQRGLSNLFIISHRPIWAEDDPQYSSLFKDNTRSLTGTNFKKDVYPLLERIAEHAHVYWISGSMGGFAPSSIFMQQHAKNITYVQCAIRDELRDAILIADVYPDTVKWTSFSLTGQRLETPQTYNAAWWQAHLKKAGSGMNWRVLPYLIKTTVLRAEFWWGVGVTALLAVLIGRLRRRR